MGTLRVLEAVRILNLERKRGSTRLPPRSCTGKCRRSRKARRRLLSLFSRMALPNSTPTGSRSTTAKPITCMPATGFCSITRVRCGRNLCHRKITRESETVLGLKDKLWLEISASRDWGHAKDYVEAMWMIPQQPQAEDFVIATGIFTTVREFARMVFAPPAWKWRLKAAAKMKGCGGEGGGSRHPPFQRRCGH